MKASEHSRKNINSSAHTVKLTTARSLAAAIKLAVASSELLEDTIEAYVKHKRPQSIFTLRKAFSKLHLIKYSKYSIILTVYWSVSGTAIYQNGV